MPGPGSPVPKEHGRFDYSAIVDRKPLRWPSTEQNRRLRKQSP
jgi:hypothetical protein